MSDKEFDALKREHSSNFAAAVKAHAASNKPLVEDETTEESEKLAYFGNNVNNMRLHESLAEVEEVVAPVVPVSKKSPKAPATAPAWKPKA